MVRAFLGEANSKRFSYELSKLTRHAAILGTTGSGKTVMGKVLIEEALASGVPVIAIDPKGDLGSLGVVHKDFDFRPYGKLTTSRALKVRDHYRQANIPSGLVDSLTKVTTTVYTPKSQVGRAVNLTPDLSAPKRFAHLSASNPIAAAGFVEPIAASLLSLAGISGSLEERAESFIAALILHSWNEGRDLDIPALIAHVKDPMIDGIGSLSVGEVVSDKERTRIAAQLNTIISSPAKRAWSLGDPLDMESMLSKKTLSVFDLRWATSQSDKQYVAERIMSELYRALLSRGGSSRLRYVLYIDELAGLLPPPPASPPSKRALELLVRQARAFGLGIVVATQNPGDIDSRLFGNIGTRFIGRLRTSMDIEKVAIAMDLPPSQLREEVSALTAGGFVVNDAVDNRMSVLRCRWLASFHEGPLSEREVGWVNDGAPAPAEPLPKPSRSAAASKDAKTSAKGAKGRTTRGTNKSGAGKAEPSRIAGKNIVRDAKRAKHTTVSRTQHLAPSVDKQIKNLIGLVKKHADDVQLKVEISERPAQSYTPHLRLVVAPKPLRGLELPIQGPFVFDMTSRLIPIGNYLKGKTFSTYVPSDISIEKHARSVMKAVTYARHEAKRELAGTFYESKLTAFASPSRSEVEDMNHRFLSEELTPFLRQIDAKARRDIDDLKARISALRTKRSSLNREHTIHRARRAMRRVLTDQKLKKRTAQMQERERRMAMIDKEIAQLKKRIETVKERASEQKERRKARVYEKAHSQVRSIRYRPTNDDLRIHAQVLLVRSRGR
ncbi:MAG: helicase HerA-like domain-containing protein [Candidatus Woesearchaeota archaeon]